MMIPEKALKWINPVVIPLLRSPLHGLMSADVLLLTVTGRRSGRTYTRPASYRREGETIRCFTLRHTGWWKNLRGGAEVSIRVAGEEFRGRAEAVHDDPKRVRDALAAFLVHVPRDAGYYDIDIDASGEPNAEDLRRAASEDVVLIEVALGSGVDAVAEKAAVEQALRDWLAASDQPGDAGVEGYAAFLTEDAVWLPQGAPIQEGREAIMSTQKALRSLDDFSLRFVPTRVEVSASGDMACGIGTVEMRFRDPEGHDFRGSAKWMDVWRKQSDGSWKCIAGMDNTDELPVAPGAEALLLPPPARVG
jgi:ketosteroid isomerase-like protein